MAFKWSNLKNFQKKEWISDPSKVNIALVEMVDELTSFVKQEHGSRATCVVHVAYEPSGHSENSQHYLGNAVDLHFAGVHIFDQYLAAERFNFSGLGVYPFWNSPGLHLDVRKLASYKGARWWKDKNDKYRDLDLQWMNYMINGVK